MSDIGTIIDGSTVRFERLLDGPIQRVWDFITRREHLSTWLADGEIGPVGSKVELKQEGEKVPFRAGATISGTVMRFEPPHVLSFTWNHMAPGAAIATTGESLVMIELTTHEDMVRLVLTHSRLTPDFAARLSTGWHSFLDILLLRMRGLEPEPIQQMFGRLLPEYEKSVARHRATH